MKTQKSSHKWVTLLIVGLIFFSPGLLQGCDSFGVQDEAPEHTITDNLTQQATSKIRHADLFTRARSEKTVTVAGKDGDEVDATISTIHLVVGLSEYAASDITKRVISKYDITRRIISKYGEDVNVKAELENSINAITIEVDASILDSLFDDFLTDPDVEWVEPDILIEDPNARGQHTTESNQYVPWGVAQVGTLSASYSPGRVKVFVLDSGVTTTSELNIASSIDLVSSYDARTTEYTSNEKYVSGDRVRDRIGHGIAIAGTIGARHNAEGIVGVAPGAFLHSVKVLGKDGGTDITTLLQAIDYVMAQKEAMPGYPFVVNMSLGANIGTTTYNAVDEAVANAIDAGIVFVIAAGNDGIDASTVSPAHVTDAITVGAYGRARQFSPFSNHGPVVDLLAPGEDIVSLARTYPANGFLMAASGTSHAAPHVTGVVVRYLNAHPYASVAEVEHALKTNAQGIVDNVPGQTTNLSVMIAE